jgi:hypothetical protein
MTDLIDLDLDSLNDYVEEINNIIIKLDRNFEKIDNITKINKRNILKGLPPLHPNQPSYYNRKKTKTSKKFINGIAFIKKNIK